MLTIYITIFSIDAAGNIGRKEINYYVPPALVESGGGGGGSSGGAENPVDEPGGGNTGGSSGKGDGPAGDIVRDFNSERSLFDSIINWFKEFFK